MRLKNKYIGLLSFLFVLCAGTAVTAVSASAEANTASTVSFTFEEGASVRMVTQSTGLRFRALMSPEEYTALEGNAAYSEVTYGMIIAPKEYHDNKAITKESVFGSGATYTVNRTDTAKTYVMNLTAETLSDYIDEKQTEYKCFSGAITNIATKNYLREFTAHSYIQTTNAATGAVDYRFTAVSDARSVVYVSQLARQDGIEDPKGVLSGFIQTVANEDTIYTVEHYLDGVKKEEDTQTLTAKIGEMVTPTTNIYENYKAQAVGETEVFANGKTVIRIDYVNTVKSILANENDLIARNVYAINAEKTSLTWEAGTINGKTGVFKWSTESTTELGQADAGLRFSQAFSEDIVEGKYLSFDICVTKEVTLVWSSSNTNTYLYNAYGSAGCPQNVKMYDANGVELTKDGTLGLWAGTLNNQWVTIEICLETVDENMFTSAYRGLSVYTEGFTVDNPIYLDNIRISDTAGNFAPEPEPEPEPAKVATILAEESDLTAGNVYAYKPENISLSYVAEEIGGKSGVFKWSALTEIDVAGTASMLKFAATESTETLLKEGAYLSFEMYIDMDETPRLAFWNFGTKTDVYNTTPTADGSVKIYDENGKLLTGSMWGLKASARKQWLRFEICLAHDWDFTNEHTGLGFTEVSGKNSFNSNAKIYLDNIKVSTTPFTSEAETSNL